MQGYRPFRPRQRLRLRLHLRLESLTAWGAPKILVLTMSSRRILTLIVLALWLFLGPVSMAFDGCLLMGALCDGGPCGASSDRSFAPAPTIGPGPIAYLEIQPRTPLPANTLAALEPPPKSLRPAA